MLEFTQGNMFDAPADIRVNTVNCVGVMGTGVALAFKQRYPEMFKDYQRACQAGRVAPGKMYIWRSLEGEWVINFPTKLDWRDPSEYSYIENGLDDLRAYLDSVGPVSVALPALGCGHGGLKWERVSELIREKLSGADANILVFAPADSRRAGNDASDDPTPEEATSLHQLGFERLPDSVAEKLTVTGPIFGKGRAASDPAPWLAILHSKSLPDRERTVLRSLALELARQRPDTRVALVYASKVSEEVAQLFAAEKLETVLLLPFGVLSRKSVAKLGDAKAGPAHSLLSPARPNDKWSRALYAQASALLRSNALAAIISDPAPEWLAGSVASKWNSTPVGFVKYEHTPPHIQEKLSSAGAIAIGRRVESGTPNLAPLFGDLLRSDHAAAPMENTAAPAIIKGGERSSDAHARVLIDLLTVHEEERHQIIDLLLNCSLTHLNLDVVGLDGATAHALEEWLSRAHEGVRMEYWDSGTRPGKP